MFGIKSKKLYRLEVLGIFSTFIKQTNQISYVSVLAAMLAISAGIIFNLLNGATLIEIRYPLFSYLTFFVILIIQQVTDNLEARNADSSAISHNSSKTVPSVILNLFLIDLIASVAMLALIIF